MLKQLIFSTLILFAFNLTAQEGTTLEEYRYLSKGYAYQHEMGLDAQKEGYLIQNIFQTTNGANLIGLYQLGNPEPKALLVVLDKGKEKVNYYCIPNGTADKRIKELAAKDQINLSSKLKKDYQAAINEFLFASLSNPKIQSLDYTNHNPFNNRKDETLVSRSANLDQYIMDTPKVEKIEVPQQTKTVMIPKSSYHGDIANRSILFAEDAISKSSKKGVVSIKICVDSEGEVISTKFTQRGSTTFDTYLKKVAIKAAKNIKFAKNEQAEQCGIVSYKF